MKVENGRILRAFGPKYCETYPDEVAKESVKMIVVKVCSYPCKVEIYGYAIKVRENGCEYACD